ncbi:MAG: 4Fe-4S single cluster domain-containing protein [Eubacteriales bacterium]|jgi:anaerobic ribonucleoside-triphosphate reductase activating protein
MINSSRRNRFLSNSEPVVADMPIRLSGIVRESIVDGPQLRFVVFVQGCPHKCPGCQNPDTHDINGGFLTSTAVIWKNILENPSVRGVTFSGGEPFIWAEELGEIARACKERGLSVMTYSGWTFEQLKKKAEKEPGVKKLLVYTDYLVDGPYIEEERNLELLFRGSSNQRLIDIHNYPNSDTVNVIDFFDDSGRAVYKNSK